MRRSQASRTRFCRMSNNLVLTNELVVRGRSNQSCRLEYSCSFYYHDRPWYRELLLQGMLSMLSCSLLLSNNVLTMNVGRKPTTRSKNWQM